MAGRVTIQDIADALGLSRNTVSKAINNTGVLADATREKILLKAVEMGYKQFSYVNVNVGKSGNTSLSLTSEEKTGGGVISLLTGQVFNSSHFASPMLDTFQRELSEIGYSFMMHRVTEEDFREKRLPSSVNLGITSAFLCIEVFDMEYAQYICSLGIPTLFVDAPYQSLSEKLNSDLLIMDNRTPVISLIRNLVSRGYRKIGFIGNRLHCRSFYERYIAMHEGLMMEGVPYTTEYCIADNPDEKRYPDKGKYIDYVADSLRNMKQLPDVFFCANDFIAVEALEAFSKAGLSVPDDILLCGFDDSPESRVLRPMLTSIHIHSQVMGVSAVHLLLSRIREPGVNFRTLVSETTLIMRASTLD